VEQFSAEAAQVAGVSSTGEAAAAAALADVKLSVLFLPSPKAMTCRELSCIAGEVTFSPIPGGADCAVRRGSTAAGNTNGLAGATPLLLPLPALAGVWEGVEAEADGVRAVTSRGEGVWEGEGCAEEVAAPAAGEEDACICAINAASNES
jgi:hypothetical protein